MTMMMMMMMTTMMMMMLILQANDLVFIKNSPDYCHSNHTIGSLGEHLYDDGDNFYDDGENNTKAYEQLKIESQKYEVMRMPCAIWSNMIRNDLI